ncbi:helix-turn-helix domain-containing protein [Bradyrhizobium sp. JYMT SZCCT0180]|uniref:helix-turn-helix domain-containing protein n=1 Tax=Bradyrhizobium sp. JYMT SZCCT0180 TaxID=2807666 RepID=UPI001BAA9963|nr:helix-turn-helix domain-containing protein [Bradyrhizobium sp. JYMT SZCCT0180]MBR1211815.1 AraC family transcriptional regulator [Bradyrhizobium sp. JYMT SZCCT0180]
MSGHLAVNTSSLDSFEGLHNAIKGSHVEVTQLGRGKFRGSLSHVGIGDFSLSIGSFSVGVRTQRVSTDDKLVIGMLLNADDRVTHWSFDMRPADVLIMPPSTEHDGIFHGAAAYAAIRLDLAEVPSLFRGEARLSDPAAWLNKNVYQADPSIGMAATRRLPLIISRLARQQTALSDTVADFWKRSIIDAVSGTIVQSLPPDTRGLLPSATQLVGKVDEYLEAAGLRPVHVSEICAHLNVSRRTLHRAFYDVFGLGPISFLRHKRLCAIHSVLRESDPAAVTVAQVAIRHGFIELGRFSHYYHSLFGEYPSETLGGRGFRARKTIDKNLSEPDPVGINTN